MDLERITGLARGWPLLRQLRRGHDRLGLADTARSPQTEALRPRTEAADRVVRSVCPYGAVGCGQRVHVRGQEILHIEGDPDSPISRGRLCPKGQATRALVTAPGRLRQCLYRRPGGREWEPIALDRAMDMIADRIVRDRAETWEDRDEEGRPLSRTLGIANLGGATLDIEENYLIKKLCMALGIVQVENQARI
jgi:formate dehydrogenase major subunit